MRFRATHLGSTALTTLVRCTCGRRNYFDRPPWRCDNCRSIICNNTLRVIQARKGSILLMTAVDFTVEEVAQFGDIFAEIDQAMAHLELAAQKLAGQGYGDRAHKILGAATTAGAQKYLLVQDWRSQAQQPGQAA